MSGSTVGDADIPLRFHEKAVKLLPARPRVSRDRAEALDRRERLLGVRIPAAIKEWYSLEDSVNLWGQYTNDDYPVPLEELGEPVDLVDPPRDLAREGLLLIARENQGVASWAVRLDRGDDPPVVIEVDSWPNPNWIPCADKFSVFLFCQFWDYCGGPSDLRGNLFLVNVSEDLTPEVLDILRLNFEELPPTFGWPGGTNLRFQGHGGKILIWHGEGKSDWHLAAQNEQGIASLLRRLRDTGILKTTPYSYDRSTQPALKEILNGLGLTGVRGRQNQPSQT